MDRTQLRRRVKRMFAVLEERGDPVPDAIVFQNATDPHLDLGFFYVTGFDSGLFEWATAVAHPNGRVDAIVSPLEEESARRSAGPHIHVGRKRGDEKKRFQRILQDAQTVGIHASELTFAAHGHLKKRLPKRKFVDVSGAVGEARRIKDEEEIAPIRKSCRIASRVAEAIPPLLRPGVKEAEVAAEIAYLGMKLGAQAPSFDTIAAFGANAAEPHYTLQAARLRRNQFALFDFGFRVNRYCSDITRTFFHGSPSKRQRDMYETVRQAQAEAFDLTKPGAVGGDVHDAAASVIDASQFKGTFIHSLGHGVGLAVHDGGGMSSGGKMVLKPGMVMTVEPGAYVQGEGGVRIEDDVLITPRGHQKLTTATRDLICV